MAPEGFDSLGFIVSAVSNILYCHYKNSMLSIIVLSKLPISYLMGCFSQKLKASDPTVRNGSKNNTRCILLLSNIFPSLSFLRSTLVEKF